MYIFEKDDFYRLTAEEASEAFWNFAFPIKGLESGVDLIVIQTPEDRMGIYDLHELL